LELFIQGERQESSFSLFYAYIQFSQHNLLKRQSFLHNVLGAFAKNKVAVVTWIYVWVLYSVTLVFVSVFVSALCCFYCSFVAYLKSGFVLPPALFFFLNIA
jgi:hypothetical protein